MYNSGAHFLQNSGHFQRVISLQKNRGHFERVKNSGHSERVEVRLRYCF